LPSARCGRAERHDDGTLNAASRHKARIPARETREKKELSMTKKRKWRIAGIIAALVLSAVFFLLLIRGRTTVGEAAASAPDVEVV
jgi:hypothetical protein